MECNYQNLLDAFEKMRMEKWNINASLKWGYFFFSKDKIKLLSLYSKLKMDQYILIDLYQTDDAIGWMLWVSKIENHTPNSLQQRNIEFNKLVDLYGVDFYDGWDVEKI